MVKGGLLCVLVSVVTFAMFVASALASFNFQSGSFENTILNEDGSPDVQAGSHPFAVTTGFKFNTKTGLSGLSIPDGDAKDIEVALPAGLVGDPTATPRCSIEQFTKENPKRKPLIEGQCPNSSQVGVARVEVNTAESNEPPVHLTLGIYNLVAPPGVPAEFGINPVGDPIVLFPRVRTGSDYGVTVVSKHNLQVQWIFGVKTTFWGIPSASSHNGERGECLGTYGETFPGESCPVETTGKPFLTLPTSCQSSALSTTIYADSWQNPAHSVVLEGINPPEVVTAVSLNHDSEGHPAGVTGCERLDFSPTVSVLPATQAAGAPTGLSAEVSLPQNENPNGLAEADLKKATVALPAGMSVSPSGANGLEACTEAEIALYSAGPVSCPDASKVGTVEIETPLLDKPLKGSLYVAQQEHNPFKSLLALYLVAEGSGVTVKLAGGVQTDPATGQLTTTFAGNPPFEGTPQQPFSHLKLNLAGGPRAALMTPRMCGTYNVTGSLAPWSGTLPVAFSQPFTVNTGCESGFSPSFVAGTTNNQAAGFSPFTFSLTRADQEQGFKQLVVRTPPGLSGMLSKIQLCQEPQAAQGTCPEASKIGHVIVGAGPGPDPVYVPQAGKPQDPVYLTGPYNGAPFGLSVVVPAEAGPFNLGVVVVRSAINVDPHDAQITITSDSLPTILKGIPLDIKSVNVVVDREGFIFNPTNCAVSSVTGSVLSEQGAVSPISSRFQAANCGGLPFHPSFKVSAGGHPSHANGASLDVKVGYPKGTQANIAGVKVSLPKQLPSRLTTIQKACTEAAFNTNPATCPAASNIGTATAITPVLNVPLTGPAYLVSHGGAAFPDLVIILQGQGVTVNLVGNINISKSGITTSMFGSVPDVPISSFELKLPQGPHSALTENLPAKSKGNFCTTNLIMPTTLVAQNGLQIKQNTKITLTGCHKTKKAKHRVHRHR